MVEEGKPAPDFELLSDTGETVKLSSLRGQPVVLYFYPKDNTSGCTTQACAIRDAWDDFQGAGAVVLGVSPDDVASHFGWIGAFFGLDIPASSTLTQEMLGWTPAHPGLLEDLEAAFYFRPASE